METWETTITRSFQDMWAEIINFLPDLFIAAVIFLVGWLIASALGKMVTRLLQTLHVDQFLRDSGADVQFSRSGHRVDIPQLLGKIVKWFVIIVVLVAVFETLGLQQINAFLNEQLLPFLPRLIVAIIILLVAAVVGSMAERVVVGMAEAARVQAAPLLGRIARIAIWSLAILVALSELGIAEAFAQTLFIGMVAALTIALGLSFGLGGRQAATEYIDKMRSGLRVTSRGGPPMR